MDECIDPKKPREGPMPAPPGVLAALDRHRQEIAEDWARLAVKTLGAPDFIALTERTAWIVRVMEAISEALHTGSVRPLDPLMSEIATVFGVHEVDIGSRMLIWLQGRTAALDVLRRVYPGNVDLVLESMVHFDDCLNYCLAFISRMYAVHMQRELLQRQARTELLLNTARAAGSSLDLDRILARTARTISKALGLPNCVVMAVDEERKQVLLRQAGSVGVSRGTGDAEQGALHANVRFDQLSDFSLQLLKQKKPVLVADGEHDPRFRGYRGFFVGARSALGLPFVVNDRVVALAWARLYDGRRTFCAEEIELAQGIAEVAALGIDNARLFGEAARLAQVEERQRMARELHDTVAQLSFSIGLHAQQALEDVTLSQESRIHLSTITHLAARSGFELRSTIFALEHLEGDGSELGGLLRKLVDDFQNGTGVRVTLVHSGDVPSLPSAISARVFRVVRESLSNVRKHAHASAILVSLHCDEGSVTVCVQDNGVGLPEGLTLENLESNFHFGLAIMRQIAEEVEGEFSITSNDDGGTRVRVRLPSTCEPGL